MQISLDSSEIEIIFKDEREEETFKPEKALENFLNKNLDKFLLPLIPPPIKGEPWKPWVPWKSIKWDDWVTPIKWVDYFTKKEVSEIKKSLKEAILSELPKSLSEDEINMKFEDILKKINKLPSGGGWAMFLRQLMDVNVGTPTAQQYWLTYNPSRSEFSLTEISIPPSTTPTLQEVTDEGNTTTNDIIVPDEAYWAGWNGSMEVPTKNAIYDKIQTITESDTLQTVTDRGSTTTNTITSTRTTTTTPVDWFVASTSSTATVNNQKASGAFRWTASWWKTSWPTSARQIDWRAFVLPEQQSSNEPTSLWKLQSQINNGGYSDRIIVDDKVGGVGFKILTNGSNGTPWTTRAMTIENSGSYSWLDWTFSGVRKAAMWANSSGGLDVYAQGWNYFGFINWATNTLYSYNYPTAFVHYGQGIFGDRVGAGSNTTPSSTLTSAWSVALGKGKRVTSNYTLTVDDSVIYADASAAACSGTPTYACSHWTNQTDCEKWDAHWGCSWFAGNSCSVYNGDSWNCTGTSGCTWDEASCAGAGDQTTCEAQDDAYGGSCSWGGFTASSCTGSVADCTQWNGDETTCTSNSLFCAWDGMGGCYNTITDCGTWNSDGSNCAAAWCSFTPEIPDSCSGNYYTGNCSGTYGAACSGTSACAGIDDSTNCWFETGCTWSTAITLNLPQVTTCLHRDYWIYNDSSSSADVIVTPYSGDQIDKTTSYTLSTYKDSIHIKAFYELTSCSSFNEGACTPSGCSPTYANCSWDSMNNTCSGNAVCTGIGDQSTCESTTYFSYCSGNYYTIKNWYLLSRS